MSVYSSYGDKVVRTNESDNHEDTIQVIEVDKNDNGIFVTGGWDGEVKVWQLNDTSTSSINNIKVEMKMRYSFNQMVISLAFSNQNILFIGLSNGQLKCIQFNNHNQPVNIDTFSSAVIYIKWIQNLNMFIAFGADNSMRCYMKQNNSFSKVGQLVLAERTCCVDIQFPYMAICSLYKYRIYRIDGDNLVRNDYSQYLNTPYESKTKITSCAISSQGILFLGSFDSCLAYIPFDINANIMTNKTGTSSIASKTYGTSKTILTPVNAMKSITINNNNSLSALLIGIDKKLIIYSPQTHSEIKNFKTKSTNEITALNTFIFKGKNYLISGVGNDWAQGLNSLSKQRKSQLQIREVKESDLKKYG